ncbi:TcpD family membrane protein [Streptomyces sp. NBC_01237]|uniref:TcpD family membrane protein n=1 Tax=Streptomyces sp. NBC_01237 TaxID=2903790 RepID=UPI002DDBE579|nr:TcpD family membrane protein [Streptomyces sp. NBC_01237]WRZ78746.1 TcpD family membrane protein [Streptomyces sp. NBC_01237]
MNLALTTGSEFKQWAFVLGGNAFAVVLMGRAGMFFFKEEWGKLITCFTASVFVGATVYSPETVQAVIGAVWSKVSEA